MLARLVHQLVVFAPDSTLLVEHRAAVNIGAECVTPTDCIFQFFSPSFDPVRVPLNEQRTLPHA